MFAFKYYAIIDSLLIISSPITKRFNPRLETKQPDYFYFQSDEGSFEVEVAKIPPTIQTLTECLHRIHALEKDDNSVNLQNSLLEALGLVQLLKQNQLEEMPLYVRKNAIDSVQREAENSIMGQHSELVFLFGRCFNLSMNIKILNQCNYADPNIASRIMIDFHAIDSSLQTKLMHYQCNSINLMSLH